MAKGSEPQGASGVRHVILDLPFSEGRLSHVERFATTLPCVHERMGACPIVVDHEAELMLRTSRKQCRIQGCRQGEVDCGRQRTRHCGVLGHGGCDNSGLDKHLTAVNVAAQSIDAWVGRRADGEQESARFSSDAFGCRLGYGLRRSITKDSYQPHGLPRLQRQSVVEREKHHLQVGIRGNLFGQRGGLVIDRGGLAFSNLQPEDVVLPRSQWCVAVVSNIRLGEIREAGADNRWRGLLRLGHRGANPELRSCWPVLLLGPNDHLLRRNQRDFLDQRPGSLQPCFQPQQPASVRNTYLGGRPWVFDVD